MSNVQVPSKTTTREWAKGWPMVILPKKSGILFQSILPTSFLRSNNDAFSVSPLEFRAQLAIQLIDDSFTCRKRPPSEVEGEETKRFKLAEVATLSEH